MQLFTDSFFQNFTLYRLGPSFDEKDVPTFLYFSISGEESLMLSPYNQVAEHLYKKNFRVLSVTLPGHHTGQDKNIAMQYWADHIDELQSFLKSMHKLLNVLFEEKGVDPQKFAVGGLSRGGFIAYQLLTHPKVQFAIGIAPVTDLKKLKEFKEHSLENYPDLELKTHYEHLYQKSLYCLIGNRDERVSTSSAMQQVLALADYAYHKRVRSPNVQMRVFPSVGHLGHGSLPYVFLEAASLVEKQIVR